MGFLTPQEIAARLDDRFHLLKASGHSAPAHHQSLGAALEWSHDLLSAREAVLFRRLAVFAGGWTLEAAEGVCASGGIDRSDVLDLLGGLAAQSFVVCSRTGVTTRYRYLETVRSYAGGRLDESGEGPAVRAAHASWYRDLAQLAGSSLTERHQRLWLERLASDHANLRAALEWCLHRAPHDALRIAGSMSLFWLVRGRLSEGHVWLTRALSAAPDAPAALRTAALWGAGLLAGGLGDFDGARTAGAEALSLARASRDLAGTARALYVLGFVSLFRDLAAAPSLLEASAEAALEADDQWCLANALGQLGFAAAFRGDSAGALPYFERSLVAGRNCGDQQSLRMGLLGLGYVAVQRGAYGPAADALEEGLGVARQLGDPFWTAVALAYRCELARARGEDDAARRSGEESIALAARTGSPLLLGFCLSFAGRAALDAGRIVEARSHFEQALGLPDQAGKQSNSAIARLGLAEVMVAMAAEDRARELFDGALSLAQESGDRLVLVAALLSSARQARLRGEARSADQMAHAALNHSVEIGHPPGVAAGLEAIAGLAVDEGRLEFGARLLGAAARLRRDVGCRPSAAEAAVADPDLLRIRKDLSPETADAAWTQGEGLSFEEACSYARRGRGPRNRPASGWDSLSPAESQVTRLAALGLTNAEIGERLFISARTVQTHLSHVFNKLGVRSRRQLVRGGAVSPTPDPARGRPAAAEAISAMAADVPGLPVLKILPQ